MTLQVVACTHRGCVDLVDTHAGSRDDPIHLTEAEWVEFLAAVKAGKYDEIPASP